MKLVPCDEKATVMVRNIRADIFKLLWDFAESGVDCAMVEGFPHKNATICAASLRAAIKKYRMSSINASARKENVYLYRVSYTDKKK